MIRLYTPVLPLAALGLLVPALAVVAPQSVVVALTVASALSLIQAIRNGDRLMSPVAVAMVAAFAVWTALSGLWSPDAKASALTGLRVGLLALCGLRLLECAGTLGAQQQRKLALALALGLGLGAILLLLEYGG